MNKTISTLLRILLLLFTLLMIGHKSYVNAETDIIYVPTDHQTIQEAINNATDGDTIFVRNGTYYEHVTVDKSLSLVGESRYSTTIDGNRTGSVIIVTSSKVRVEGFTVSRSGRGGHNSGILLEGEKTSDNRICHNIIIDSYYGIKSLRHSVSNVISENTITNNEYGISLWNSVSNVISENTITNNEYGISLWVSDDNVIFHNNFVGNTQQCYIYTSTNVWDNGIEGNYWTDYTGADSNHDGIGDSWYNITQDNRDHYPLMGTFYSFNIALERRTYQLSIISNSTISHFTFQIGPETGNEIICFNATGENGTAGFCRVMIPTELMNKTYIVLINRREIDPSFLAVSNETYNYLYFSYFNQNRTISIISSKMLSLYYELREEYNMLQMDLYNLNLTYYHLLNNYNKLLSNYSEIQKRHQELNRSYRKHLSDYFQNARIIQNLRYIFAATTAILIITTVYLSKHTHTHKTKVSR